MRPTFVIECGDIDESKIKGGFDSLMRALYHSMVTAREYMLYPGHIENWNIIIDVNERALSDFPFS